MNTNLTPNRKQRMTSRSARMVAAAVAVGLLSGLASPAIAADSTWQTQKQAYVTAMSEYRAAMIDRHLQINAIRATFLKAAQAALPLAGTERKSAMTAARAARDAAIAALPAAPVKPVKPVKPAATNS